MCTAHFSSAWLDLAIGTRKSLRSVRSSHHVKQGHYMKPQQDHIFLALFSSISSNLVIIMFDYVDIR